MNYLMMVPVKEIRVGERRREDFGDLQGLADSIEKYGLLHPIVIDQDKKLVVGERRLRAVRDILGWEMIQARDFGELTDDERQEIELEENLRRKDLTPYERSKNMVELARVVGKRMAAGGFRPESGRNPEGGRPKEADSVRVIADEMGVKKSTLHEAEQHAAIADQIPAMQGPLWKQSHVLEAGKHLNAVEDEHTKEVVLEMIQEPFIPPATAVRMLKTLAEMPDDERRKVADLYESEHPQDQSLAKTKLMQRDPMPDPRATVLGRMVKDIRELVRAFPNDPITPAIAALIGPMKAVVDQINRQQKERIDGDSNATVTS